MPLRAMWPRKPPAKESPAPVGSTISSRKNAAAGNTNPSLVNRMAPFSPFLIIANFDPHDIIIYHYSVCSLYHLDYVVTATIYPKFYSVTDYKLRLLKMP